MINTSYKSGVKINPRPMTEEADFHLFKAIDQVHFYVGNAKHANSSTKGTRMKKIILWMCVFGLGLSACAPQAGPSKDSSVSTIVASTFQAMTSTAPTDSVLVAYRNVSLTLTPPLIGTVVVSEDMPLRDQKGPADMVPDYVRITIDQYPVIGELSQQPRIMVYPLNDLIKTYPEAASAVTELKNLLDKKNPQFPDRLPFWPLTSVTKVEGSAPETMGTLSISAQPQFLDFKSGKGIRYITQYDKTPPQPINGASLFYTYQGLTDDGEYYIAVILPISASFLAYDANKNTKLPEGGIPFDWNMSSDQGPYYAAIKQKLNSAPDGDFFPGLSICDALSQSLTITP